MSERQCKTSAVKENELESSSGRLTRRELICVGSGVLAGAAGLGAFSKDAGALALPGASATVPVGFWMGSAGVRDAALPNVAMSDSAVEAVRSSRIVCARSMGASRYASTINKTACITVHGLYNDASHRSLESFALRALFPVATGTGMETLPFEAWHYAAGNISHKSNPVSFVMPLDAQGGLRLALASESTKKGAPKSERVLQFMPTGAGDAISLRQGLYLLALSDSAKRDVNWQAHSFHAAKEMTKDALDGRRLTRGASSAAFPYLVVSIENVA